MDRQRAGRSTLHAVQAVRFLAALLVVLYHANIFSVHHFPRPADSLSMMLTSIGRGGVHIFFVISGFIMMYANHRAFNTPGASLRFFRLRFIRIYPTYWIFLLAYLVSSSDLRAAFPRDVLDAIGVLALWPGLGDTVVSVAWTLSFEMYFYLVFGFALFLPRRAGLAMLAIVLILGIATGRVLGLNAASASGEALYGSELLLFLAGVGIGRAAQMPGFVRLVGSGSRPVILAGAATILLVLSPTVRATGLPPMVAFGPAAILLVIAAVAADLSGRVHRTILWFSSLGDSSYALYLSHILVMGLLNWAIVRVTDFLGLGVWGHIILLAALSVLLAHWFYLGVEKPMQTMLRRTIPGARSTPAPHL